MLFITNADAAVTLSQRLKTTHSPCDGIVSTRNGNLLPDKQKDDILLCKLKEGASKIGMLMLFATISPKRADKL